MKFLKKLISVIWKLWRFIYRRYFDRAGDRTASINPSAFKTTTIKDYLGETHRNRRDEGRKHYRNPNRPDIDFMELFLNRIEKVKQK